VNTLNVLQSFFNKIPKIKCFHWTSGLILTIIVFIYGCGSLVYHVVEPGETLYSISWMYGYDYKTVAKWNGIKSPYILHKGQRLRVAPYDLKHATNAEKIAAKSVGNSITASGDKSKDVTDGDDKPINVAAHSFQKSIKYNSQPNQRMVWFWPVKEGRVVQTFEAKDPGKLGIDVAGKDGQTIYSASNGTVVYSGNGLPLYGKLIIIKHNEMYLSAYAHNKKLLVKEGDEIKAGQPIALMGNTGSNHTKLHFEIRLDGKPVDPMHYLPEQMPN
jgi:lipoprotein NlpD